MSAYKLDPRGRGMFCMIQTFAFSLIARLKDTILGPIVLPHCIEHNRAANYEKLLILNWTTYVPYGPKETYHNYDSV